MLIEQNWRTERVPNISQHLIERAHRRYGLATTDPKVAEAWGALAESAYKLDLWGMDSGGTTHIPGTNYNNYAWVREIQNSTELSRQALTLLCVYCLFSGEHCCRALRPSALPGRLQAAHPPHWHHVHDLLSLGGIDRRGRSDGPSSERSQPRTVRL